MDKKPGVNYCDVFKVPDTSVKVGNVGPAPPGLEPSGSIEIQGNTYRGLVAQGPFHPFTFGLDGAITWTGG